MSGSNTQQTSWRSGGLGGVNWRTAPTVATAHAPTWDFVYIEASWLQRCSTIAASRERVTGRAPWTHDNQSSAPPSQKKSTLWVTGRIDRALTGTRFTWETRQSAGCRYGRLERQWWRLGERESERERVRGGPVWSEEPLRRHPRWERNFNFTSSLILRLERQKKKTCLPHRTISPAIND